MPEIILANIKKFLVESSSNVASVAFKILCEGKFTAQEAKEYAAKNILLNINAIFRETVKEIQKLALQPRLVNKAKQ